MNALELIKKVESLHVRIELVDAEHIALDPIAAVPDDLLCELKRCKHDVISYLEQQQTTHAPSVANDDQYSRLPRRMARAMRGYEFLLNRKKAALRKKGYSEHSAMLKPSEWCEVVAMRLDISSDEMQQLLADLIARGELRYGDKFKNNLLLGDGVPLVVGDSNEIESECLHDGTGKGFLAWFYASSSIH